MAGSYNHCINDRGHLLDNDRMMISGGMIENLGDAYEAIEEMYGMIWFLAAMAESQTDMSNLSPAQMVELARKNYQRGLRLSKELAEGKKP